MSRIAALLAIFAAGMTFNDYAVGDSYDHFAIGWMTGCIAMCAWQAIYEYGRKNRKS